MQLREAMRRNGISWQCSDTAFTLPTHNLAPYEDTKRIEEDFAWRQRRRALREPHQRIHGRREQCMTSAGATLLQD